MIRITVAILILAASVFWAPFWVQGVLFFAAILLVRHRIFLLLPAVLADALYVPGDGFHLGMFHTTLVVAFVILVHFLITTQTRFSDMYVSKNI